MKKKNKFTLKELQTFRSRMNVLDKERRKLTAETNEIYISLQSGCHCPENHRESKSSYFGGSYLDTDYTMYWDECIFCKKQHNKRTKDHGHYG